MLTRIPTIAVLTLLLTSAASGQDFTIRLTLDGQRLEGKPAAMTQSQVMLLARDGQLWQFAPDEATDFSKVSDTFASISQAEMRGQLAREFGRGFEVSGTGHYLVVHPAGQRDLWAERFESLYRQFMHYFTARGFRPHEPEFPLVAVVFHNQRDFVRFAAKDGVNVSSGTLGYYSPKTNRVLLFDTTAGQATASPDDWTQNADTIIHEATHQTAFNTGVHSRLTNQPKWIAEGLATMFEAPGVWNSRDHRSLADRVNRYRLQRFRANLKSRRRSTLAAVVESDRLFQTNPDAAYAEAWALSFYLAERRPRDYFAMLTLANNRPPLQSYSTARRLADFRQVFGDDLDMLEVQMLRFIETL